MYPSIHPMVTITYNSSIETARDICRSMCLELVDIADENSRKRVIYYNRYNHVDQVFVQNLASEVTDLLLDIYDYESSEASSVANNTKSYFSCEQKNMVLSNLGEVAFIENEDKVIDSVEDAIDNFGIRLKELFKYDIDYDDNTVLTIFPDYFTFGQAKEICERLPRGKMYQPMSKGNSQLLETIMTESKVCLSTK